MSGSDVADQVVFVKGEEGHYHRTWITREDGATVGLVLHVMHDLPHLVVESVFCLDDGLWASLVGQGEYPGLTPGHLAAKALTNAITNRFGDGPDTPDGVRARLGARDAPLLNDDDLEIAIAAVRRAFAQWAAVDVGGKLSLAWPLSPDECRDLAQA